MTLLNTFINGPADYTLSHKLSPLPTLSIILGALAVELSLLALLAAALVAAIINIRSILTWVLRRIGLGGPQAPYCFLQLTIPSKVAKSAFSTEQLHILLRQLDSGIPIWTRLASWKVPYALEIAATKAKGTRFVVRIPESYAATIERTLRSYLPDIGITRTSDYLESFHEQTLHVCELKLAGDFALPLASHAALHEHDPVAYLTGHMRELQADELAAFQLVVAPLRNNTHPAVLRRIRRLRSIIAGSRAITPQLRSNRLATKNTLLIVAFAPLVIALAMITWASEVVMSVMTNGTPKFMPLLPGTRRPTGDPYELELAGAIKAKLDQPLFEVSVRLAFVSNDQAEAQRRLQDIAAAFQPFNSAMQAFRPIRSKLKAHTLVRQFRARTLSSHLIMNPTILASAELSDLYHLPHDNDARTEGLMTHREHKLPAPLSQRTADFDVILGQSNYGQISSPIGLTLDERRRHTYIIGKTGMGKTTLLKSAIYQDMMAGKGVAVLDPHGDLFHELIGLVPPHRIEDVVIFNPADRNHPVGLNILNPGITFASDDDRREWITSLVITVFKKLSDAKYWGPKMEHILRNATLTALSLPDPTLYTIQRLLTDQPFRTATAAKLDDPILKQFWVHEFSLMGKMQLAAAIAPLTQRIGQFITATMSRHILLQSMSTLSVQSVMDEGRILLVNLSKGELGEDQSTFFGTLLTSLIWTCAYQRAKLPEAARRDFFLYVDEFQTFATPAFGEIISEGRKFRVALTASHQNIAQIEDTRLLKTLTANSSSLICFKASPDDEALIAPFMAPEVTPGDITALAPYQFFIKTSGPVTEDAFSAVTVPLEVAFSQITAEAVTAASHKRYALPKPEVMPGPRTVIKTAPIVPPKAKPTPTRAPVPQKRMVFGGT